MHGRSAVILSLPPAARRCSRMALVQAFYGIAAAGVRRLTAARRGAREKRVEGGESAANNGETPGDDRRKHSHFNAHYRTAGPHTGSLSRARCPPPAAAGELCDSGAGRVGGAGYLETTKGQGNHEHVEDGESTGDRRTEPPFAQHLHERD